MIDGDFIALFVAGFAAQLVDGALGMGFGIVGTTIMLWLGLSPASASAMVHIAEVFTTGASGLSHALHRNVDWAYVRSLALPGIVGGALGAYVLVQIDGNTIRPFVTAYLAVMGGYILYRAITGNGWMSNAEKPGRLSVLGFAGGFLDAAGGGGWGPIVTGTLVGRGHAPRFVVGSVSLTEFFVTVTISATFILTLGITDIRPILGFVAGGIVAAPLAGFVVRIAPTRPLRGAVGALVLGISAVQLYRLVGGA
jgi:hypothetical protein